ncbi:FMN-binding negative transcriptional regulator [Corallococcus terminator]
MYIPHDFEEQDPERLLGFMKQHSFATLVTAGGDGRSVVATHLPFLIERTEQGHLRLLAHMARLNPQWRGFTEEREALVIFQGPHGYVSPTWYVTAPQVPTWNYATVHAHGHPRVIHEPDALLRILRDTAAHFESGNPAPWQLEDSEDYVHRLLPGIVAFELLVTRIEGVFKLSQNKGPEDRQGVINGLERGASPGNHALAALMRSLGS